MEKLSIYLLSKVRTSCHRMDIINFSGFTMTRHFMLSSIRRKIQYLTTFYKTIVLKYSKILNITFIHVLSHFKMQFSFNVSSLFIKSIDIQLAIYLLSSGLNRAMLFFSKKYYHSYPLQDYYVYITNIFKTYIYLLSAIISQCRIRGKCKIQISFQGNYRETLVRCLVILVLSLHM